MALGPLSGQCSFHFQLSGLLVWRAEGLWARGLGRRIWGMGLKNCEAGYGITRIPSQDDPGLIQRGARGAEGTSSATTPAAATAASASSVGHLQALPMKPSRAPVLDCGLLFQPRRGNSRTGRAAP